MAKEVWGQICGQPLFSGCLDWQAGQEIEDWELWGDPREIERRKAERARASIPPRSAQSRYRNFPPTVFAAPPAVTLTRHALHNVLQL